MGLLAGFVELEKEEYSQSKGIFSLSLSLSFGKRKLYVCLLQLSTQSNVT